MTEPQDPQPNPPSYPGAAPTPPGGAPVPPYGPPTPTPNPYGQPTPYGQPAPNPYGQQGGYPQQPPPAIQTVGSRPGVVLIAGIITILLSGLTLLTAVIGLAAKTDMTKAIHDYLRDDTNGLDLQPSDIPTDADIRSAIAGVAVVLAIVAFIGIGLGIAVLLRQGWARILLIVTSSLTVAAAILPSFGLIGLPWLGGSITVIVLLAQGKAKAWFSAPRSA